MSKWEMKEKPVMVPVQIDANTYQEHLAQIAKILYKKFCQLDPRFKPVPIPLSRHCASKTQEVRR